MFSLARLFRRSRTTDRRAKYPNKPYTRWWWFSEPIDRSAIEQQLDWLAANGFGGVEIAWVYPLDDRSIGPKWLSRDWQSLVAFAKRACDRRNLGCDFTFGTLWPFGGSSVDRDDAAQTFDSLSDQRLDHSWEKNFGAPGYIINHLSHRSLENYAAGLGKALRQSLRGSRSALFCDSWEVHTEGIWSLELWEVFEARYGYDLYEYRDRLNEYPDVRYDYRRLVADSVVREFYEPFRRICKSLHAWSRVQCHGAPADLLEAYASVDIPESEALLFPPSFSRIAASAAALASQPVVSAETFTCMYGFPATHLGEEQTADLKLLVDSIFAQGVNHVVWHGMPYNSENTANRFFASVHVGPDASFADDLPELNRYIAEVCKHMRSGRPYTNLAVYLPLEDGRMLDRLPAELTAPSAHYHWELHYVQMPSEVEGYHPIWVSMPFLRKARSKNRTLVIGESRFEGLYIDCHWFDADALNEVLRLAESGLPVVVVRRPSQPGHNKSKEYSEKLKALLRLDNVVGGIADSHLTPLLEGDDLPPYWARDLGDSIVIFFANPKAKEIAFPMQFGQALQQEDIRRVVTLKALGFAVELNLEFKPYQSILVKIGPGGQSTAIDIHLMINDPEVRR